MATKILTDSLANRIKPNGKDQEIRDKRLPELVLIVRKSGTQTYYCQWTRGRKERLHEKNERLSVADARKRCREVLKQSHSGAFDEVPLPSVTLSRFIEDTYRPHFELTHPSSKNLDNLARFGMDKLPLDGITQNKVKVWRTKRLKAGISPATCNRNINALKAALSFAVSEGILAINPLTGLSRLPVAEQNRVRYLSPDELERLTDAIEAREQRIRKERVSANGWRKERGYTPLEDLSNLPYADYLKPMILIAMHSGLRQGELFSLTWDQVNDGVLTVFSGKSRKTRHVPLSPTGRRVIEQWHEMAGGGRYVFGGSKGRRTDIRKAWHKLLDDAGIQDFRWHDLRHHYASTLVMKGVPLNDVRELLGHSDLKMTLRYSHLSPTHLKASVEVLG